MDISNALVKLRDDLKTWTTNNLNSLKSKIARFSFFWSENADRANETKVMVDGSIVASLEQGFDSRNYVNKTDYERDTQTISTVFTPNAVGWWRVASIPCYMYNAVSAFNPSCTIRFYNVYNTTNPGFGEISIIWNDVTPYFVNELSQNNVLFDKIRICTNNSVMYIDIHYNKVNDNNTRVTIDNSHDAAGRTWVFMDNPYIVPEVPDGDNVEGQYSFNNVSRSLLSTSNNLTHIVKLTQAEYDALTTKDPNTIYLTT